MIYFHSFKSIFVRLCIVAIVVGSVSVQGAEFSEFNTSSAQMPKPQKSWLGQSFVYGTGALFVGNIFSSRGFNVVGDACKYGAGMLGAFGLKSFIGNWFNKSAATMASTPETLHNVVTPDGRVVTIERVKSSLTSSALNWNKIFNYGIGVAGIGLFAFMHRADFSHMYANIIGGFYGWKGNVPFSDRVVNHAVTTYQSLPSAQTISTSLYNAVPSQQTRNFFMAQGLCGLGFAAIFSGRAVRAQDAKIDHLVEQIYGQQNDINYLNAQKRSDTTCITQLTASLTAAQKEVAEMRKVFTDVENHLNCAEARAGRMDNLINALDLSPATSSVKRSSDSPRTPASKVKLTLEQVCDQFGTPAVRVALAQILSQSNGSAPAAKVGGNTDRRGADSGSPYKPQGGKMNNENFPPSPLSPLLTPSAAARNAGNPFRDTETALTLAAQQPLSDL